MNKPIWPGWGKTLLKTMRCGCGGSSSTSPTRAAVSPARMSGSGRDGSASTRAKDATGWRGAEGDSSFSRTPDDPNDTPVSPDHAPGAVVVCHRRRLDLHGHSVSPEPAGTGRGEFLEARRAAV